MDELDLRAIFGVLRRRFRLIAVTFTVVVVIAAVVIFSLTPIYSSSALILVDPSQKNLLDPETESGSTFSENARIDSEVELIRSENVLLRAIEAGELITDEDLSLEPGIKAILLSAIRGEQPPAPSGEEILDRKLTEIKSAITVQRRGLTQLITLQARSEDPQEAARLANVIAEAYVAEQVNAKVQNMLSSRNILQAQISAARESIVQSEGAFDGFIEENLQRIIEDTGNTQIASAQQQIEQLTRARSDSAALVETVQQNLADGNFQTIADRLQSQAVAELERQRAELNATLAGAGQGSPAAADLRAQLASLEERLQSTVNTEVSNLQTSLTSMQAEETRLREELRKTVLGSALSADVLTRLYELQQSADLARSQYQTLLTRVQDLDTQTNLQVADSRIVSQARPSQSPSFPNIPTLMILSGMAALGLGVGLAFLYENFIGGFTSEAQLQSLLKTRVAGTIPRYKGKGDKESVANLMITSPLSGFAESVRRLRSAVEHALAGRRQPGSENTGSVVMVTSTEPGEGKTTLALSLARSYALSDRRTLLIDCDLRRPALHRNLGMEASEGLLDYLSSHGADAELLERIVSFDEASGATVIVGARGSHLPTDQLLSGHSFERLVESARKRFDVIILDTPPIGPVVDGLYIASLADAVVFVTKWASTAQMDARKAVEALETRLKPGTQLLTVLSQQDEVKTSYNRKYGQYYAEAT